MKTSLTIIIIALASARLASADKQSEIGGMLRRRKLEILKSKGKENDTRTARNFGKSIKVSGGGGKKAVSSKTSGGSGGGVNRAGGDYVSPK